MKEKFNKFNSQKIDWYDYVLGAIGIVGFWFWSKKTDLILSIIFMLYMLIKYIVRAMRKR